MDWTTWSLESGVWSWRFNINTKPTPDLSIAHHSTATLGWSLSPNQANFCPRSKLEKRCPEGPIYPAITILVGFALPFYSRPSNKSPWRGDTIPA